MSDADNSALGLLKALNADLKSHRGGAAPGALPELQSARLLERTFVNLGADRRVRRALLEVPEDPGPLNPHRLAIDSLAAMNSISPAYVNQLVAQLETLFWLQESLGRSDS